jgi:hypothetical protein
VYPGREPASAVGDGAAVRFTIAIFATRYAKPQRSLPIIDASWRR